MKEYTFDVKLFSTIRVKAENVLVARKMLEDALDCADSHFGAWPNGDPILGEASIDGHPDLVAVDDVEVAE